MNKLSLSIQDTMSMVSRSMKHTTRQVEVIIITVIMPLMQLFLLVTILGGAMKVESYNYIDYVLPGILLMTIANGAAMGAVSVKEDMSKGIMDRFRTMDIGKSAVLNGHLAATFLRTAISSVMVIGVAFLLGFRTSINLTDLLIVFALLFAFTLMYSWLAIAWGLICPSLEAVGSLTYLGMFLPYLSSCFVPVETMPAFIQGFVKVQPFTAMGDSLRGLLLGLETGNSIPMAFAWCIGLFLLFYIISMRVYHKQAK